MMLCGLLSNLLWDTDIHSFRKNPSYCYSDHLRPLKSILAYIHHRDILFPLICAKRNGARDHNDTIGNYLLQPSLSDNCHAYFISYRKFSKLFSFENKKLSPLILQTFKMRLDTSELQTLILGLEST